MGGRAAAARGGIVWVDHLGGRRAAPCARGRSARDRAGRARRSPRLRRRCRAPWAREPSPRTRAAGRGRRRRRRCARG
eukprot:6292702-Prymnesium_polylepis.1